MNLRATTASLLLAIALCCPGLTAESTNSASINFETAPVHPIALSPDNSRLAVCNLPDGRLEVFDVTTGTPLAISSIPVGIDPVSVRFRNAAEAWVINHISDSISIIDLPSLRVVATLDTLDTPSDVVFAGSPIRAFVSCAMPNVVQVFDPASRQLVTNLTINAERPKALAVSPDGQRVYAAIFESGNATTVIGARMRNLLFIDNVVSRTNGPYAGRNPPPNDGDMFTPPLNQNLPTNRPPPNTSLIVRRNDAGRWLDDNQRDWTEFVSGTNAALTQRVQGWDLPDRDLAVIDATTFAINYASGLMNICMAVEPNPATGRIAVVGTDASNEVRFEPNLNGVFVRVKLAMVDPLNLTKTVADLNPHLDYTSPTVSPSERAKSIGDPRAIAWSSDGTRGYVAGMGSRNVILINANGARLPQPPIEVGEGPCGLALDEIRGRLYVYHRFSSSLSVVDTSSQEVRSIARLFDPTPLKVSAGRRHLYDTRRTSGLGQGSCASCHVDARMDRLGWDLGNPAGELSSPVVNHQGTLVTNTFHPTKGVMVTQTMQDIIGHEPFHWRGDRADIEAFNGAFTNLQGAASALTTAEMREFRDFLASIRFPPNPYRNLNNSLATNVSLGGMVVLGDGELPNGTPLPNGNAERGLIQFNRAENFCRTCHTLPTGLGFDTALQGGVTKPVPTGPHGGHSFPLAFRLENSLRSKIAQFRNMPDKTGMSGPTLESRAGFGFGHDGTIDSLPRFLNGLRVATDQDVADLTAFLFSAAGSDSTTPDTTPDNTPVAGVGRQLTLVPPTRPALFDAMLSLARSPTGRVELIAKGSRNGLVRGWVFDATRNVFQSDRRTEVIPPDDLISHSGAGAEVIFTLVAPGTGTRLGIDRDLDSALDRDELDAGTNPADLPPVVQIHTEADVIAFSKTLGLDAVIGGLPAPLISIAWLKDGALLANQTNASLAFENVSFAEAGDYSVQVTTAFQSWTGAPVRISIAPAIVSVSPAAQQVRSGSNATFTAKVSGVEPFSQQWRFNGVAIIGATQPSLTLTAATLTAEGSFDVVVTNAFGSVTSAPATLGLLISPSVVLPPLSLSVPVGGDATFSFVIAGHPPPFSYQLKKSSSTLTNYSSPEKIGFLTLHNVQSSNAGTYRVIVTNAANPSPGLTMPPVLLTVLADTDADGLPDEWEIAQGFEPTDSRDALLDADLDGLSNLEEYLAGTNPRDSANLLRVERISLQSDSLAAVIHFQAVAGKTYSVESRDLIGFGNWTKLGDIVAMATNRMIAITNATDSGPTRIYRLATPRVPSGAY